jgi:hypothetical protein
MTTAEAAPSGSDPVGARSDKEAADFMLLEYQRISEAFFSLYSQMNEALRTYLTLMTVGSAAVALEFEILPQVYKISFVGGEDLRLLGALLLLLGLLGIPIFMSFVGIRGEMILYARTVNGIRGYFSNRHPDIRSFLVLPTTTAQPSHYEGWNRYFIWQLLLISSINAGLISIGTTLLFLLSLEAAAAAGLAFWFLLIVTQLLGYRYVAQKRDREFTQGKAISTVLSHK